MLNLSLYNIIGYTMDGFNNDDLAACSCNVILCYIHNKLSKPINWAILTSYP